MECSTIWVKTWKQKEKINQINKLKYLVPLQAYRNINIQKRLNTYI